MKNSPETLAKRKAKRAALKAATDFSQFPKTKLRICKDCGEKKECKFMSDITMKGEPIYRTCCDACQKKREKVSRRKNRTRINEQKKKRNQQRKRDCIEYKGGSCEICGYNKSQRALTFHHLDPTAKEFSISQIKDHSWSKITKELDKCQLLCMNCHMEIHDEALEE